MVCEMRLGPEVFRERRTITTIRTIASRSNARPANSKLFGRPATSGETNAYAREARELVSGALGAGCVAGFDCAIGTAALGASTAGDEMGLSGAAKVGGGWDEAG